MKNTFAVTMTLLLALVLGGSVIGYNIATRPHEAAAHAPETAATETAPAAAAAEGATGEAPAETASAGTPATSQDTAETPAAAPAGDIQAGKTKFAATCAACHGANAEGGMGGLAPKLNLVKGWTPEQFTAAVRDLKAPNKELKAPMMKFDATTVSDADVTNIHAWLSSLN